MCKIIQGQTRSRLFNPYSNQIKEAIYLLGQKIQTLAISFEKDFTPEKQNSLKPKKGCTPLDIKAWVIQAKLSGGGPAERWNHDFQWFRDAVTRNEVKGLDPFVASLPVLGEARDMVNKVYNFEAAIEVARMESQTGIKPASYMGDHQEYLSKAGAVTLFRLFEGKDEQWIIAQLGLFGYWFKRSKIELIYLPLILYEYLTD